MRCALSVPRAKIPHAAVAAVFDIYGASNGVGRILSFEWGLPLSKTVAFRFHALGVEACLTQDFPIGVRHMVLLRRSEEDDAMSGEAPDLRLRNMSAQLSLRTFSRHHIAPDAALHWQQKVDIESVLSHMLINKTPADEMERVLDVLPADECHEEAKEQILVYRALANPQRAGEAACKDALARAKVNTDNSLFHVRYQRYGQDLKAACQHWVGSQMSSSLSTLRLTRLATDAEDTPKGLGSLETWSRIKTQADEFKSKVGDGSNELLDRVDAALAEQVRCCVEIHQASFDDAISAISLTITDGNLVCDHATVVQARATYQRSFEELCKLKDVAPSEGFAFIKQFMCRQREVFTFVSIMSGDADLRMTEQLESLAGAIADIGVVANTVSAIIRRPKVLSDGPFLSLVAETKAAVVTSCSTSAIVHLQHVIAAVANVFGESAPGHASFNSMCSGEDKFPVASEAQSTAEAHIHAAAKLLPNCDCSVILAKVHVAPSFLHGAFGLCKVMRAIVAIKALAKSHRVMYPALRELDIARLVMPNNKDRKTEAAAVIQMVKTTLTLLRAAMSSMEDVRRFAESDHALKKSTITSDVAQGSTLNWINTDSFKATAGHLRTSLDKLQGLIVTGGIKSSLVDPLTVKLAGTTATLDECMSDTSLSTWDAIAIRKACLAPLSIGIANLRDLTKDVYKELSAYNDIDPVLADLKVDSMSNVMSRATRHFHAVTAIVGLFRHDKQVFCTKLVSTLCKPGTRLLPDKLEVRLEAAANGE